MKRVHIFFVLLISFFIPVKTKAQNNCPLHIKVSTEVGTCYNNCLINIQLVDATGHSLDSNTTDLSDFKYFCINTSNWDTTFSFLNTFTVSPGTYKVGVQAICYYSIHSDSMYIRMERDTVVTTTTTYETPVLSMVNHTASSLNDYGLVPSLSCVNTGRVQLKITGGSFPYYVKMCDEFDNPIDTMVFHERQYSGEDELRYDYKDYYSIDSLAPGRYNFYLWDDCGYFLPRVWQEINTDALPYIENICWYYYSGNTKNHNVVKFQAEVRSNSGYYAHTIPDVIEYRVIYPEIGGVKDTSAWKHLPNGNYSGTGTIKFTLYDTARLATRYCDLFDNPIVIEARNTLCDENPYSSSYTYERPPSNYTTYNTFYTDSSIVIPAQYDSCGIQSSKVIAYGHTEYSIYHLYGINSYTTCDYSWSSRRHHYYTYPLYWVYTDTATHTIIKIDTVASIGTQSTLRGVDIVRNYGDFSDSTITIPLQRALYDGKGCELNNRFDQIIFQKRENITGGSYQKRSLYADYSYTSEYCCSVSRKIMLRERNTIPMVYNGDAIVELIESPLDNKYNFTASFSQNTQSWSISKDSLSNLSVIKSSNNSMEFDISDYCLASGKYTFRITTPCSTYVTSIIARFPDRYEYAADEWPVYEQTAHCTELTLKPVAGKYSVLRHNVATTSTGGLTIGQPYTTAEDRAATFQIISGPTGGYSSAAVSLNEQMRITMPGTYVVRMQPSGTYLCEPEVIYDTIVFSGGTVEYEYDYAYVCDSLSTTGFVRIKGMNGTPPYTYTLYSGPDMTGTILGENTTGRFDHVPLHDGQHISTRITDACMASFHVNFFVSDLQKVDKSWFTGGAKVTEACEGSYITVYALGKEDIFAYEWTGPNGFSANTREADFFIPRNAEDGYYKVKLMGTGCGNPIADSIYINVTRAARVSIAKDTIICPGEEMRLSFSTSGTGDVYYTIGHEENSVVSYQHYTNDSSFIYHPTSSGIFWVHEVSDDLCTYSVPEDSISITIIDQISTSCDISAVPDTTCLDGDAVVFASSSLGTPYIINWYDDYGQQRLLKSDTIQNPTDQGHFSFSQLGHDTTLFVTSHNSTHCETKYGTINRWMNMHAGFTHVRCGESIRFYDSGGYDQDYGKYENIIHTFSSTDGNIITLIINNFKSDELDKLMVFTGSGTQSDSLLATFSGDMGTSMPVELTTNSSQMTVWFLSNGQIEDNGWDAVVSNKPYPASVTAVVSDSVKVSLSPFTSIPVHYDGEITLQAKASGGKSQHYEYHWFSSNDGSSWTNVHQETTHDTSYYTFSHLTEPTYVKVSVADASIDACEDTDTTIYFIPIAHIKLSLALDIKAEIPCNPIYSAYLTIRNDGSQTAEDITSHIHLPNNIFPLGENDTIVRIDRLNAGESRTDTLRLMLRDRLSVDTNFTVKAQIWSCLQGDSIPETVYGDWDWQGMPRFVDEDTASIHIQPVFSEGDYLLTTINDEVCYGEDARLSASSNISSPQYFKWFSEPSLTHCLKTDTISHTGDQSYFDLYNLQSHTTLYVSVQNTEFCPPMASGLIDFKYDTPVTDTVIMCHGITTIGMHDHIKFYDTGGPTGFYSTGEDLIHTFTTSEGVLKIRFNNISVYNSTIYIYDGATINSPLIASFSNLTGNMSFTSTGKSLTIRFRSTNTATYTRPGWDADIVNSQTHKSAEAVASLKAPEKNINISTTDAEICYGQDAILTASSTIAFPQYYTWYDQNMNILQYDSIISGVSTLTLPEQITENDYYVAISNDTSCNLIPIRQETLLMTADLHLSTTFVNPYNQIKFYDNGGPDRNYTYHDTIITHTFKAQPGQQVAIQFNNVNYGSNGYFRLYDGEYPDETQLIGTLPYSLNNQRTFISSRNNLTISFKLTNNYRGWDALVYSVDSVLLNPSIPQAETHMSPGYSYRFLDEGGSKGNYSYGTTKSSNMHTFKSSQGDIALNILPCALGSYDTLYIYRGNTDDWSKLLYRITGSNTSFSRTIYTNDTCVTFKFVNSNGYYGNGWDIIVRSMPYTAMAQAKVKIKAPSSDTKITSTNDTICYGDKAILSASSTITAPQYYTWYNSDGTEVVLRDTVSTGVSLLELPNQKVKENFLITVNNSHTCPIIVSHDTIVHKSVMSSSLHNNQTIFLTPSDQIQFTDEGGEYGFYYETPIGTYTTTFTALQGRVKAVFSNTNNSLTTTDTLYLYGGIGGDSLLFKASSNGFRNKTFESTGNSLTFKFMNNSTGASSGWDATITNIPDDTIAQAWVYIREPGTQYDIISSHDTLCYDETAVLHAHSPNIGFPQYYTWISQDLKDIIYQDTVDGISKTQSTLLMNHQRKDTSYYVTVKTDTICPMRKVDSVFVPYQTQYDLLLTKEKNNKTTLVYCSDSISFYDEGGKESNYFTNNAHYVHTFISAFDEPLQLTFTFFITESTSYDYLAVYDGVNTSAPLLAKLGGTMTSSMPRTFTSHTGNLTVEWITNYTGTRQGWVGYIKTIDHCKSTNDHSISNVIIRTPLTENNISTSNDTVCYDREAFLTASSDIDYPQYFTWWDKEQVTMLYADTVATPGGMSVFKPAHQTSDSLYYVHVSNDGNCPFVPERYKKHRFLKGEVLMNSNPVNTINVHCTDSIPFYDDGGKEGRTSSYNQYFYQCFTAEEGQQVVLHIDTFSFSNNSSYTLKIYDGNSSSGTLLATLYGSGHKNLTYTSTRGSLYLSLRGASNYFGWIASVTTDCDLFDLAEAEVYVYPEIPATMLSHTTCQSTTPINYMGFNNIDISIAGNYIIDSVFTSHLGCDSTVTLSLTVNTSHNIPDTVDICLYGDSLTQTYSANPYVTINVNATTGVTVTSSSTDVEVVVVDADNGDFLLKMTTEEGCDSIVTLHVGHSVVMRDTVYKDTLFTGTSYTTTFEGMTFTVGESGTISVNDTVTGSNGCDSVTVITLIVEPLHTDSVCSGELASYTWNGNALPDSTNAQGYYEFPGTKTIGSHTVDTVSYLQLTVSTDYNIPDTVDICLYGDSLTQTYSANPYVTINVNATTGVTVTSSSSEVEVVVVDADNGDFLLKMTTEEGCDSIVTLHVGHSVVMRDTVYKDTLFTGTSYTTTFEGMTFTVGEYGTISVNDTVTGSNGCDSVTVITLIVEPLHTDSVCSRELASYTWNGNALPDSTNAQGYYEFPGTKTIGSHTVDTVSYLQLTISTDYNIPDTVSICLYGDSLTQTYSANPYVTINVNATTGVTVTSSSSEVEVVVVDADNGDFLLKMTTEEGCDSIVTLHVGHSVVMRDTVYKDTLFTGTSYTTTFEGMTFTVGESGTISVNDTVTGSNGCDSVTVITLIVEPLHTDSVCSGGLASYTWNGNALPDSTNAQGYYEFPGTKTIGSHTVDTVSYLQLTISTDYDITIKDTLCASALPLTIGDTTFGIGTVSGHYTLHRHTIHGCDSIINILLTINDISVTVTSVTNAVCGNDGSITLSATGKAPFEYSLDGISFQSSNVFTGIAGGTYTVTVRDANTCTATATAIVGSSSAPDFSISCPPDIHDTLAYGDCVMKIYPHQLGTPSVTHSLSWPFTISNDIPADSLYHEGDNLVTWIVTDDICGYADTCYQHIVIVFPQCPDAVDFEGNIYHGVRIGCDCWTQRNLESQKYSDGTDIPCVYEYVSPEHPNVIENVSRYGRLYCYEAVVRDSADNGHGHIQGICPEGWYLPTPEKYQELNTYGTDALRSPLYWISGGGSNTTGFSALPAGFYNGATNRYEGLLGETYFWSVAGVGTNTSIIAYSIILDCDILLETQQYNGLGYSVRCIKEKD